MKKNIIDLNDREISIKGITYYLRAGRLTEEVTSQRVEYLAYNFEKKKDLNNPFCHLHHNWYLVTTLYDFKIDLKSCKDWEIFPIPGENHIYIHQLD